MAIGDGTCRDLRDCGREAASRGGRGPGVAKSRSPALGSATPLLAEDNFLQLTGAVLPAQPRHAVRYRVHAGLVQLQPFLYRPGQPFCGRSAEEERMVPGDLAEHGYVPCNDGQLVLGRLDQRQAEPFTVRSRDQASTGRVYQIQVLVADGFQPEHSSAGFLVRAESRDQIVYEPTLLSYDYQVDIDVRSP